MGASTSPGMTASPVASIFVYEALYVRDASCHLPTLRIFPSSTVMDLFSISPTPRPVIANMCSFSIRERPFGFHLVSVIGEVYR
jgi:hypothetical protein